LADCITILLRSDRRSAFVAFCVQAGQGQRDDGHKDNFHHGDLHYSLRFDQFGDYLTRHDAATITPMHVAGHDAVVRTGGGLSSFQWDPWAVLNIGFENRWEAVFEGKGIIPVSAGGAFEITDPGISLKHVLVPGSLQDQTGPSIATEFGVLLPEVNGEQGIGATLAGIVSQRWDWGTIHFNVAASLTREHAGDLFTGLILEGPSKWVVPWPNSSTRKNLVKPIRFQR
jgi:hypothetical protein